MGSPITPRPMNPIISAPSRGGMTIPAWAGANPTDRIRHTFKEEERMKKLALASALALAFGAAQAQTVKIGMPLTLSGQFADAANQMLNGARTYMKMHGDTVAGRKIELITKDVGGPAPDVAKRLSQELVVRDNVDILAGYVLTPNAMAGGDVSA